MDSHRSNDQPTTGDAASPPASDETAALPTGQGGPLTRAVHLALAGVIGLAFVGFFVGIRQGTTVPELRPPQRGPIEPHPDAVPATAYRDFDRRLLGPNRDWRSTLADLAQPPVDLFAPPQRSEETRLVALSARAERRAFDGAPPVVPHPIDQMGTASCLVCHGEGLMIGKGVWAPRMSHAYLANCTQCHVEQQAVQLEPLSQPSNEFEPFRSTAGGSRAWPGAPPTVPHPVFMREDCLSCHGPAGSEPLRTTHPYRASCLQCHAPSAALDQR
jgi:nitrate reductase (cytochrome), electron transfer subunit